MNEISTIAEICEELDRVIPLLTNMDSGEYDYIKNYVLKDLKSWLSYSRPSVTIDKWADLMNKLDEMTQIVKKDRWSSVNAYNLEAELFSFQVECLEKMRKAETLLATARKSDKTETNIALLKYYKNRGKI